MSDHEPTTPAPRPTAPAGPPVPDDRVHGDTLHGAPYGDPWLRPTLTTTERGEASASTPVGPGRPELPPVRRAWLVAGLGATLVLSSIVGALSWDSLTGGLWRSVDQQQTYTQAVDALTIKGGASDIDVIGGGAAGTVHVARHLSWGPGSSEPTPTESWNGSTLRLDAECNGLLGWCSVDYVVTVPDATDVIVDNGSGDITLTGSLGGVTLSVGSGDIETANLRATTIRADAGSGDIDLELATPASPVQVATGSGDVSVRVPQDATYAVTLDAGSGDKEVNVANDPRSAETLYVKTGSGDIAVDYR